MAFMRWLGFSPRLRDLKDNLAELLAALEPLVSSSTVCQRHHHINHGLQQAASKKLERREKVGLASHERSKDRKFPRDKVADVELAVVASRCPASHQPPARHQAANALFPCSLPHMLKHHVHPAPVRQPFHFSGYFLLRVIDLRIGAQFTSLGEFFF